MKKTLLLLVTLLTGLSAWAIEQDEPVASNKATFTVNGVSFTMVGVEGGTFTMGATEEQGSDYYSNERPTHQVTLDSYYIGETEVTEALWTAVMGSNPSYREQGDNYPVEYVTWEDCQTFITKLNALTGESFRLPTEAEWEFAARGGNESEGYKYAGSNTIDEVAWYSGNSGSAKHPVATKAANELGLYDMSGNVWEWCQDWYGGYSSAAHTNPSGPTSGSYRVFRGGSWSNIARDCRVSYRTFQTMTNRFNDIGLRLAISEVVSKYSITVNPTENGTVTPNKSEAAIGETVTLTVTPDTGYELGNITVTARKVVQGGGGGDRAPQKVTYVSQGTVEVTKVNDNTYTFVIPETVEDPFGEVAPSNNTQFNVVATFKEASVTGIVDIKEQTIKCHKRYNLMGQPVGKDYKGIVIEDGKKLIVR